MRYFDELGNELDPNLIPRLDSCRMCQREALTNEIDRALCIATRYSEMKNAEFVCSFFEPKAVRSTIFS